MGHSGCFLTRRAPLSKAQSDCGPTGMAISSCCEIWFRALRMWCLWILSFALSQKNGGNQWNIGQFYQDAWWGFIPAPLLFTHPSLQNRCSFGILSCSDVCASDTTLLGLLFTYRLFTSICASNMCDTQPALFFILSFFKWTLNQAWNSISSKQRNSDFHPIL